MPAALMETRTVPAASGSRRKRCNCMRSGGPSSLQTTARYVNSDMVGVSCSGLQLRSVTQTLATSKVPHYLQTQRRAGRNCDRSP